MQRFLALGMVLVIGALLIYTVNTNLLEFGTFPERPIRENSVGQLYIENAFHETGSANVVTSIVWGYRGYDTIGESIVLFTAVIGVLMVFRALKERERMAGMTVIVRTISRLLFPFVILFGIYIVLHGHLTPGGGFPGGVIIASSFVMLILAYGIERTQEKFGFIRAEVFESAGGLAIILIGICGLLFGVYFLQNAPVFPLGTLGRLFSAGNLPILYMAVGLKVAAGVILIFYAMTRMLEIEKEKS